MPNIQHSVLDGSDLHEPKGVAGASNGQYYVADGAGSGNWVTAFTGWGNYSDNATEQTFDTTPARLSINGLGTSTEEDYLPLAIRGSDSLWDTTADAITPIAVGDAYDIRLSLPVSARTTAQFITLQLDVGGGVSPSNVIYTIRIDVDRTAPFIVGTSFGIYTLATFLANGGQFFISVDAGSIGITAPAILINRSHAEMPS